MWRSALTLVAAPLADRVRRAVRRGMLLAAAVALGCVAFMLALVAIFAYAAPLFGPAQTAAVMAGGLAMVSAFIAWLASRRPPPPALPPASAGLDADAGRSILADHALHLVAFAFAAGLAAGRKW
jgi:hypothetical protein